MVRFCLSFLPYRRLADPHLREHYSYALSHGETLRLSVKGSFGASLCIRRNVQRKTPSERTIMASMKLAVAMSRGGFRRAACTVSVAWRDAVRVTATAELESLVQFSEFLFYPFPSELRQETVNWIRLIANKGARPWKNE